VRNPAAFAGHPAFFAALADSNEARRSAFGFRTAECARRAPLAANCWILRTTHLFDTPVALTWFKYALFIAETRIAYFFFFFNF